MKLSHSIFEEVKNYSEDEIKSALNKRMFDLGFTGVGVLEVDVELDGDQIVTFVDEEGGEMDVLFSYDDEDGAEAIILDDDHDDQDEDTYDDEDDIEVDMVDLDALEPELIDYGNNNKAIDLVNNRWMNTGFFETLFLSGDLIDDLEDIMDLGERKATVVRGGKKVKVALFRRKRRKRLTPKQRAGVRKAARKRRQKAPQIARKRKRSLKLRKRLKLRKNKNRRLKVKGT